MSNNKIKSIFNKWKSKNQKLDYEINFWKQEKKEVVIVATNYEETAIIKIKLGDK